MVPGPTPPSPWPVAGSVAEDGLDDAVCPAVEAVIEAGGVVQRLVVGDDLAGPGPPADDQVTQMRGVPAVVRAAEPDADALVEQRRPGHLQRPVGVPAL